MAIAIAADSVYKKRRLRGNNYFRVYCRLTPSGNYPNNGDVIDFKVLNPNSPKQPVSVDIYGQAGFIYQYDLANKKFMVRVATTTGANLPLAQHSAAAYDAAVIADTIIAEVTFA
jgi:hypothetical protein